MSSLPVSNHRCYYVVCRQKMRASQNIVLNSMLFHEKRTGGKVIPSISRGVAMRTVIDFLSNINLLIMIRLLLI